MPYVMMPVPEEHVEAVMNFVLRAIARAAIDPWDEESVGRVFLEVDEAARSLLSFVARAAADGSDLDAGEAARKIQLTVREVLGIMNELNATNREANRPPLITAKMVNDRLPNGRVTEKRVLNMEPEVADLIKAAEQAELREAGNPLGGAAE
jgi:hypothetical protein